MEKLEAIAAFLEVDQEDIDESSYNDCIFEYGSQEYLVVTDDEADTLQDESLERYLVDCIYPQLPDSLVNYFDDEAWKRDARFDGRGHSLSSYDGHENFQGEYFIYRVN